MSKINISDHLIRWNVDGIRSYAAIRQLIEMLGLSVRKDGTVSALTRYVCVNCPGKTVLYLTEDIRNPHCPRCGNDSTEKCAG